jgi:hypothetical protein
MILLTVQKLVINIEGLNNLYQNKSKSSVALDYSYQAIL